MNCRLYRRVKKMIDEELLLRYLTRTCSDQELNEIAVWVAADKANARWLLEMRRTWSLKDQLRFSDQTRIANAYWKFVSGQDKKVLPIPPRKLVLNMIRWAKYVAAAAVLAIFTLNMFLYLQEEPINDETWNTIEVPGGQSVQLTLSDGSNVCLNSKSKFMYPSRFSSKSRTVKLEGEAYFEIAHNEKAPFLVSMPHISVKVLGTKFNAMAYPEEKSLITLIEGKVDVSLPVGNESVILLPNEQASYSSETGLVKTRCEDANAFRNWTSGKLSFSDQRLDDIMRVIERKYNVRVHIVSEELAAEKFTCNTKPDPTLKQVLNLLKNTRKLNYKMTDKEILITKNVAYEIKKEE